MNGSSLPSGCGHAPTILAFGLLALVIAISVWDIWAVASGHEESTVSNVLGGWASRFPMLGVLIGAIIGHIFWTR